MIRIDLQNIKNGTINLILNEVDFIQKADTYYYAIDKHLNKDNDSTYKVLNNLKQLFLKWDSCLKVAFNEGCKYIYLPFDFTDEYIGFLKVEFLLEKGIKIEYGYSEEVKGYSISPSKAECFKNGSLINYDSLSDSFDYNQAKLLKDIEDIRSMVDKYLVEFKL